MKQYLLPESGRDFKANLHCHTNLSDGAASPERVKQVYLDKGYSIIAYTDHDILLDHSDLCDEDFLALNGFEIEVTEGGKPSFDFAKCFHVCLIAKEPDNLIQPCYHRSAYLFANAPKYRDRIRYDESKPDFVRAYTPECFAEICREGRENGFFVTYNHPAWSVEGYPEYSRYEGMDAMEYFNGGCIVGGWDDINPRVYDDLLRQGKRLYCIGTDDNHNSNPDIINCDAGIAWTMIRADKLEYRSVTKALEKGHFYASMGPEIHDLYVEDGRIHITTSDAVFIRCITANRPAGSAIAPKGQTITSASFPLRPEHGFFRLEVVDACGNRAVTNAYFPDSLG